MVAVVISAARVLLPSIGEYRAEVISSIGRSIGNPIEIDRLSGALKGFWPEVVLSDVKVLDPGSRQVLLRFDQLRVGLNLKELLFTGNFQPRWVTIQGAKLSIVRKPDGAIRVVGVDSGGEMPNWIFEDGYFELLDSQVEWQDQKHSSAALHFSSADIRLLNNAGFHQVAIDVDLPANYGKSLAIRMHYRGNLLTSDCCDGNLYIRANDVYYGRLLRGFSTKGYSLSQGYGDFEIWSQWKSSAMVNLSGMVNLRDAILVHGSDRDKIEDSILRVPQISGTLHWTEEQRGWSLAATEFSLDLGGETWPEADFSVKRTVAAAGEAAGLRIRSSYLNLADLDRLLVELRVLPADEHLKLVETSPRGELFDLEFEVSEERDTARNWRICARIEQVGFNARAGLPGASNLSGLVCGDEQAGHGRFDSEEAEFDLPEIFRQPIDFSKLEGKFTWRRRDQWLQIQSQRITAENQVLSSQSRMLLDWPLADGEPFLDAQVSFRTDQAALVHHYLPVGVLRKPLVDWLDTSFLSGSVTSGGTLFRGPISAFPFRAGDGVFETLFYTKDVRLSYHRDWPPMNTQEAEVRFYQDQLNIRGENAQIFGTRLSGIRASVDDFWLDDYLVVTGSARGPISQSIKFLRNTPLAPLYEPLLEYVSLRGDNRIGLKLEVPIAERLDDILVKGTIALNKASLKAFGLEMRQVRGKVHFSQDRIQAQGIDAMLLGSPVQVDLTDNDQGQVVQIGGKIGVAALARAFPNRFWRHLRGATDYQLDIQIPRLREKLYADIGFSSDLTGIALQLPPPLEKASQSARGFSVKTHLEPGGEIPVDLAYSDLLHADLKFAEHAGGVELTHGSLELGQRIADRAADKGLSFYGRLDQIAFSPWRKFFASLGSGTESSSDLLTRVDLEVNRLIMAGVDVGPFTLRMQRRGNYWDGMTDSAFASGQFNAGNIGQAAAGMELDFKYLRIPEKNRLEESTSNPKFHWDPGSIPSLKIRAEQFFWKKIDFGKLELATTRQPKGMKIDRLKLLSGGFDLNLSGYWTAVGPEHQTFISGDLEIEDLGQFLTRIGKSKLIKRSPVRAKMNMKWRDPLYDLNVSNLSGFADFKVGQGRILNVEPGFGRVFGLFNLNGLKNLLLLDFGQLFGKGLAFEGIKSTLRLVDGHAKIANFVVDAVPAEIRVDGDIDLAAEELNDVVTVVPKGVVAAGASMLLTQELPGTAVDGLINRQYKVTGKWDNPKIERLAGTREPL